MSCFAVWYEAVVWKMQPPFQGVPLFPGILFPGISWILALLNVPLHSAEEVTDWLGVTLTSCLCPRSLCAVPRTNSSFENFKSAICRPRGTAETNPVPAQSPSSSCSGLGTEVSCHLCFSLPTSSCLMRHQLFVSTELLRQGWSVLRAAS